MDNIPVKAYLHFFPLRCTTIPKVCSAVANNLGHDKQVPIP